MTTRFLMTSALAGLMLTTTISHGYAATITVTAGAPDTVAKSLGGDTLIIQQGGTLAVAGTTAVTTGGATGNTITNNGSITATAANFGIQVTPSGGTTTITNTGSIAVGTGQAVRIVADNNTLSNSGTISTTGTTAIFVIGNNNQVILNSGSTLTGGINFAGGTGNTLEYTVGTSCAQGGGICTVAGTAPTILGGTLGVEYSQTVHTLTSGTTGSAKTVTSGGTTVAVTQDNAGHNNTVETQVTNQASTIATQQTQSDIATSTVPTSSDEAVKQKIAAVKAKVEDLETKKKALQDTIDGIDGILEKVKDSGQQEYIDHLKKQRAEKMAELAAIQAEIDQLLADMPEARSRKVMYTGDFTSTMGTAFAGIGSLIPGGDADPRRYVDLVQMTDAELTTFFWTVLFQALPWVINGTTTDSQGNATQDLMATLATYFAVAILLPVIDELNYRSANTITGVASGNAPESELDKMGAALKSKLPQLTVAQKAEIQRYINMGNLPGKDRKAYRAWAEVYGSYRERPTYKNSVYAESRNGGVVAGISLPDAIEGVNYSAYASGFTGSTDIGKTKFRTIDTDGAMIGAVAATRMDAYDVSGNISAGFSSNESDRVVGGGSAHAKADYNSYFVNPSVTVGREFVKDTIRFRPSVTAGYTLTRTESYTEYGSTANQAIDGKTSHMLSGRAQMEAIPLPIFINETAYLKHTYRVGVQAQRSIGDQSIDVTTLGQHVTLDPDADKALDGIIGINLDYMDMITGLNVYFDTEAALGLNKGGIDHNMGVTSKIGLRWAF